MATNLKAGDHIRWLRDHHGFMKGDTTTVTEINSDGYAVFEDAGPECWTCIEDVDYELLAHYEQPTDPLSKGETNMATIANNLINANIDADTRYARRHNLEAADGSVTSVGVDVLNQYLWNTNRKAIVAAAKAAEKAIAESLATDQAEVAPSAPKQS